ncbi:MAG: AAA family ATPase [Pseudomonadota bacterium]
MTPDQPKLILLTGAMAAGKSTVAQALAETMPRSVHLRGDVFRRMIVNGRVDMGAAASEAALAQLNMRYSLARDAARTYLQNGFNVIYQDVVLGPLLLDVINLYSGMPL